MWACWFFFNYCNFKKEKLVRAKLHKGPFSDWVQHLHELLIKTAIALPHTQSSYNSTNSGAAVLWQHKVQRVPLRPSHCTNPSLRHHVCWRLSLGKLEKNANYFIAHNGTKINAQNCRWACINFFFRAKILESKALAFSNMDCLPECLCIWYPEVWTGEPTPGHHHKPIILLGFQAAAGLVAQVHTSSSCCLTDFPA